MFAQEGFLYLIVTKHKLTVFIKYFEDKNASKMRGNFHKNSILSFYVSLLLFSLASLVRHSL
jgi:hypothetical protein